MVIFDSRWKHSVVELMQNAEALHWGENSKSNNNSNGNSC